MTSKWWLNNARKLSLLASLLTLSSCRRHAYVAPEQPMPANTILLSEMLRELSTQPGFTEALLGQLGANKPGTGHGPVLLTPKLVDELRKRILGKDWSGLDRFPGWTMHAINATVTGISDVAGKKDHAAAEYLDVGPYALDKEQTVNLQPPSTAGGFTTQGMVKDLGDGVVYGDGPNALAPEHAVSQGLAEILNRLAANKLDHVSPVSVSRLTVLAKTTPHEPPSKSTLAFTPEDIVRELLAEGIEVTVTDSRYFANFSHLHDNGKDVMAPFWVDPQIVVPDSGGRPLLVPVAHAELEWHIRTPERPCAGVCPKLNADVSYYFGIDGKAEWRVMDTLDQAWVLKRDAHTYTGDDAIEVTRLAGLMTAAYMRLHQAHPALPFGGYYTLGVCQDGVAAIEHKMTGKVTLFPNTADASYFNDPHDAEINALIRAIPKDREGDEPDPERVFGSLPTDNYDAITIPGLATDLEATHAAWIAGKLERPRTRAQRHRKELAALLLLGAVMGGMLYLAAKRRARRLAAS